MKTDDVIELHKNPHDTWLCPICHNSADRTHDGCTGMTAEERQVAIADQYAFVIAGVKILFRALYWKGDEGVIYGRDRWSMHCAKCLFEWDAT